MIWISDFNFSLNESTIVRNGMIVLFVNHIYVYRKENHMKKLLKVLSIILIVSLIGSPPTSTKTMALDSADSTSTDLLPDTYAYGILPELVEVAGVIASDLSVSQSFQVYNTDESLRGYFVFDYLDCIGYLSVNCIGDQYSCSFIPKQFTEITELFINEQAIFLVAWDDGIFAVSETATVIITNSENSSEFSLSSVTISIPESAASSISLSQITTPASTSNVGVYRVESFDVQLDIPYVGVGWSPTGVSLCWASAVCSIAAYRLDDPTPMTARQLYDALLEEYPEDGNPVGTDIHVMNAFIYFGFYNFNLYDCGLSSTQIKSALTAGRPVFVGMNVSNGTSGHAVALCGIRRTLSNHVYYTVMDHQLQKVVCNQPIDGSFAITIGSKTYTRWTCAVW